MEIDGVVLRNDRLVQFQYVLGDDRPYIQDVIGKVNEMRETTNRRNLICLDVRSIDRTDIHTLTYKWFWVDRIVSGSFNNVKEGLTYV